ncbi:uncharacterized protein LOC110985693 [Acanthaster planci]|uniref:Uncharacterized protein LOC110985693 n=1 Tax=Acanthaster planci TaxID=133434 RepID=A0A8B7ZC92_ACAPL|nr:uncharacterized protein LOC110985693 [Acanthaster planci]
MHLPNWVVVWMSYLVLFVSVIVCIAIPRTEMVNKDDTSLDYSQEDYSNVDHFQKELAKRLFRSRSRLGFGFGGGRFGNSTSGKIPEAAMKCMIGISVSAAGFLASMLLLSFRKKFKRYCNRTYRYLYKRWADRYELDRQGIMEDLDDDHLSSSGQVVVDRVVFQAGKSTRRNSTGGTKQDYTAVPPDSPVKTVPSSVAETVCPLTLSGPQRNPKVP